MARPRAHQQAWAWLSLILSLGTVTSCSAPDAVSGPGPQAPGASQLSGGGGLRGTGLAATLLACPAQPEVRAQKNIGPGGGTIQLGPHRLVGRVQRFRSKRSRAGIPTEGIDPQIAGDCIDPG